MQGVNPTKTVTKAAENIFSKCSTTGLIAAAGAITSVGLIFMGVRMLRGGRDDASSQRVMDLEKNIKKQAEEIAGYKNEIAGYRNVIKDQNEKIEKQDIKLKKQDIKIENLEKGRQKDFERFMQEMQNMREKLERDIKELKEKEKL